MINKAEIKAMEVAMGYIDMAQGLLRRVLDNVKQSSDQVDDGSSELSSKLDSEKTFLNFIEGDSNKMARTVGKSIAEQKEVHWFNPFFIYGPSGCGKTHLINAIGVRYKEFNPQKKVIYVGARQFQTQYTDSVRQNTTTQLNGFYQSADLLIVDDIQEWTNAPKTLETFCYIFNQLVSGGKQVILACDRPPVKLKGMKKDLLTRFVNGLVVEIEIPNEQLRIDILTAKCSQYGMDIQDGIIEYIARNISGNVCVLEGVVNSLMAYSKVNNSVVDMDMAACVIKRLVGNNSKGKE